MNSTINTTHSENRLVFPLKFGLSLAFLALITLGFVAFCLFTRKRISEDYNDDDSALEAAEEGCCNEKVTNSNPVSSFPTMLYSEAKLDAKIVKPDDEDNDGDENRSNASGNRKQICCCSICLSEFNDSDMLRLLPDCNHFFHLKCIDLWLKQHNTCPICRKSNDLLIPVADQEDPVINIRREFSTMWFAPFVR